MHHSLDKALSETPDRKRAQAQGKSLLIARSWLDGLGSMFPRVALFALKGTQARLIAGVGISRPQIGTIHSLHDHGPLKWTVHAASPQVGAGMIPEAQPLFELLGIKEAPRAFAILPLVVDHKLLALAYIDNEDQPLGLEVVSKVFSYCDNHLSQVAPSPTRDASGPPPSEVPAAPSGDLSTPPPSHELTTPLELAPASDTPMPWWAQKPRQDEIPDAPKPETAAAEPLPEAPEPEAPERSAQPADAPTINQSIQQAQYPSAPNNEACRRTTTGIVTPKGIIFADGDLPETGYAEGTRQDISRQTSRVSTTPKRFIKAVGAASLVLAISLATLAYSLFAPPNGIQPPQRAQVWFEIPPRASAENIAHTLQAKGMIRHADAFYFALKVLEVLGADDEIKAGHYQLRPQMWPWELIAELRHGQVQTVQITIPEGLTLEEIADEYARTGITKKRDFLAAANSKSLRRKYRIPARSVEGYLFPETYTFARGIPAKAMVEAMIEQFFHSLKQIAPQGLADAGQVHESLILASIIEKEAHAPRELPRIAGVFRNRLRQRMRLESHATIQYVLKERKEKLSLADIRIPSPYNTYLHEGLPPGPIANPSSAALRAAFHPETNEYLFFTAKQDGSHGHLFSRTFAEHKMQVAKTRD